MNKNLSLFFVALVLGAVGSVLALLYLKAREADIIEALRPKSPPIAVVVASKDLVKGDLLNADTLSVREIPSDFVDPNTVKPEDFESIDGEVLIQNLASGKPLLRSFIDREFPKDFSDTLAIKRRAMSIQIDEINSFSGLLRPGNRVDILVKLPVEKGLDRPQEEGDRILPVLENVEVIATGKDAAYDYEEKVRLMRLGYEAQPDQNFTTITLNLSPKEAALLSIAKDKGDFIALLRNRKDLGGLGITGVSRKTLEDNAKTLAQDAARRAELGKVDDNLVRSPDGLLRTKDGKLLANQDLVLAADGSLMTKDGLVLSGQGLSIDSQGRLVTVDGRVLDPATLKRLPDGTLVTADGVVLSGGPTAKPVGTLKTLADGTLVTEDGRVISGATLNADGKLVLADGRVIDSADLVVTADGKFMTKDGKPLAGVAMGQTAGGLRMDAQGHLVTPEGLVISGARLNTDGKLVLADGSIVDPADVVITPDGTLVTKDGRTLAGVKAGRPMGNLHQDADGHVVTDNGVILKGARLTEDGKLILANGSVVDPQDLLVNADGSITRKSQVTIEGAKVRADGTWELADGRLVDPKDVIVHADGSLTTKDGKVLEGVRVRTAEPLAIEGAKVRADGKWELADGRLVDPKDVIVHADGSLTTKDGKVLEGVRVRAVEPLAIEGAKVRADGKWELADGRLVDPKDVIVHADGSLTTKDGKVLEGVRVKTGSTAQVIEGLSADFSKAQSNARPGIGPLYEIDYIIGGASKDGVAPVQKLPVMQSVH